MTKLTYLILLTFGVLSILTYSIVLKTVSVLSALILIWFDCSTIRMKSAKLRLDPMDFLLYDAT